MSEEFVRGSQKLKRRIETIRKNVGEATKPERIEKLLLTRMRARFAAQLDPDGKPWPELAPETIENKRKAGYKFPTKALHASGRLEAALGVIRGSATFGVATGAGFRIGIADKGAFYGRFHHRGEGVPQREIFGIGASDVKAVDNLLRRDIIRAIRSS